MERLEYDLLFRWFVGLGVDDPAWDHSTFSKNRDRLLEGDIATKILGAVLAQPRVKQLLSTDHFSVDGTLIEAWASLKKLKPKDGSDEPPRDGGRNAEADFRGERRSNATHASTTDPDARLYRKGAGKEAKLCFMGHALMENCSGLLVGTCLTRADGQAERVAALALIEPHAERPRAITLGADKAFDAQDFVNELRTMKVTPHVPRTQPGARGLTGARRVTRAMPRASACASKSRRRSAGSRPSLARGRPGSVVWRGSGLRSPSQQRPTISCACRGFWAARDDGAGGVRSDRSLADRQLRSVGPRLPRSGGPGLHRHRRGRARRAGVRRGDCLARPILQPHHRVLHVRGLR